MLENCSGVNCRLCYIMELIVRVFRRNMEYKHFYILNDNIDWIQIYVVTNEQMVDCSDMDGN